MVLISLQKSIKYVSDVILDRGDAEAKLALQIEFILHQCHC